jgi:1-phosphatidylinositol-3-phosphate 5-kinase
VHESSHKTLTIESKTHLHKFIGHVLEEETGFRGADKDAWVSSIGNALNDLAREVDAGAWLSGIRRARALEQKRKEQAAAEARKREQERIAKEKEAEARNKTKTRAPVAPDPAKSVLAKEADTTGAEAKPEISHVRKPPSDDVNRNLRALQQLRNLAKTCRPPSSDDPKRARHLLLTVVLPEAQSLPQPAPSAAAGESPSQRCTFTPYVFSLPAADLFGEDPDDNCEAVVKSTLYGFREWDGALRCYFPLYCAFN